MSKKISEHTDFLTDYVLEDQIGYLLRRAYQRHTAIFQSVISDATLTSVQFAVMMAIRDHQPAPLIKIGRVTAIDHATLRDVIMRLKRRGVLEVRPDQVDRRQRLVSLSGEGEALIADVIAGAHYVTEQTLAPLDACEKIAAIHVLKKLAGS